ncbi:outer membrane protein OmpA-like peptidoglycan-associated protein [Variovorax sp. TBS-050B]|uniref:OmpA family protein n=1 Tax=Variovorax sp. TBS-050B TaxID=2940551 RepID=UPI002476CBBB|nr:OmpA family protein [Variovorax sp. TBS-050B]MDH6593532.1 outer membrane protein OmpA-like peptidoglycan-associated protein [Variovorax sp. TBS-050B]
MSDHDQQQNFVLGFLVALIALVILFVVGIAFWHQGARAVPAGARPAAAAAPAAAPATTTSVAEVTETVTVVIPDGASIRVADGVVNFYFATGSADLAPRAAEALAAVIKGVESGRRAVVSGFHDTTGDPVLNEQLAKQRADTVRDVLVGLGVPASKVDLQKPAVTAGSGNDAEARRVEVRLVD